MVHLSSTGAEKGSTGQMSSCSISSLYHTEAVSVNYTAHNASRVMKGAYRKEKERKQPRRKLGRYNMTENKLPVSR